jgi:uncharacterized membrane protein
MQKPQSDLLLSRGVWCLVVGIFTSWLLGLGLLFIFAAAICGFVGLFRQRALQSLALLVLSIVVGVFCAHIAAVTSIYVYNTYRAALSSEPAHVKVSPAMPN